VAHSIVRYSGAMPILALRTHLLVLVALVMAGCASGDLQVRTDYDQKTSFAELKTFLVTVEADNASDLARFYGVLRTTIVDVLGQRGFTKAEHGSPDFWVVPRLSFSSAQAKDLVATTSSQAEGGPAGTGGLPKGATLTVQVIRPDRRTVLWEGAVTGFTANAVAGSEPLKAAARRLLAEFPPLIAR